MNRTLLLRCTWSVKTGDCSMEIRNPLTLYWNQINGLMKWTDEIKGGFDCSPGMYNTISSNRGLQVFRYLNCELVRGYRLSSGNNKHTLIYASTQQNHPTILRTLTKSARKISPTTPPRIYGFHSPPLEIGPENLSNYPPPQNLRNFID